MAENSGIQWTKHTWNPWRGCSKVVLPDGTPHPGCQSCYAERMSKRNPTQLGIWGDDGTRVRAVQKTFEKPLKWDKDAAAAGRIDNVFVDSMSDFFEDREDVAPWRVEAFDIMHECQHLNFQVLTKRPYNVLRFSDGKRRPNVTLCYSASNQHTLDYGAPKILRAKHIFGRVGVSLEPMLGACNFFCVGPERWDTLHGWKPDAGEEGRNTDRLDWVIVGVESNGPRVGRLGDFASEREWWTAAAGVAAQCLRAGVPCFMKQGPRNGIVIHDHWQFPEDCSVREFPQPNMTEPATA